MARKLAGESDHERSAKTLNSSHENNQKNQHDSGPEDPSSEGLSLPRRSYLYLGGATLAAGTFSVVSGESLASPATTREGIAFDRVVHAVDDLGLDPTGSVPVNGTLNSVASGTLVQFPAGEFLISDRVYTSNMTLGLESIGDERATFVVAEGNNDWLFGGHGSQAIYFKGFVIDQTAPKTIGALRLIGDRIHIEDIEFVGRADIWDTGAQNMLNCSIESPDGYGEIRNLVHRRGHWARYGPGASGRMGIYTGRRHVGTLKVVDCDLREFGNNAMYCSRNTGKVQVEDSYFENNNVAAIRIGGEGSYAENCTIVVDPSVYDGPRTYEDSSFTMRGIVIEERFETGDIQKPAGAEIRNCDIRIEDNPANGAAIHRWGNGRSMRVVGTTIEYNNDGYPAALLAQTGGIGKNPDADPPKHIEFVDSVLHGTGNVDTAIQIDDSDESLIDNSIIYMKGASQNGVTISNSDNCYILDSTISVPNQATVFNNSSVTTENIDHDEPDDIEIESDESDALEHQLRIIADDDADAFEYTFTVDGEVELVTDGDYPANPEGDKIIDNGDGTYTVEGIVAGYDGDSTQWGGDTFRFEGTVTAFHKEGPATVYLDGVEIDPVELVGSVDDEDHDDGTMDQLRIIADEDADAFEYTFTVDGEVELVTDGDYPANPEGDKIIDNGDGTYTVEGIVAGYDGDSTQWGGDTFAFSGELLTFSKDGPATVLINGEVIDPSELTETGDRFLRFEAGWYADTASFEFVSNGEIELVSHGTVLEEEHEESTFGETIEQRDDGAYFVAGELESWQQTTYRITGAIKGLAVTGPIDVSVNNQTIDPDNYGLVNQLTIIGIGSTANYEVTVEGELAIDPNVPVENGQDISGSTAEGAVVDGLTSYRFDGEITSFRLDGEAGIYLNGVQVDPDLLGEVDDPSLANWITVNGDGDKTEYIIEVTGGIHKAPDLGPVDVDDVVDDGLVTGSVVKHTDGYRFNGELRNLWVLGTAEVRFGD